MRGVNLTPPPPLRLASRVYLNPIAIQREEGGESARDDFKFQELPYYSSNTYEMLPLLLNFIGE